MGKNKDNNLTANSKRFQDSYFLHEDFKDWILRDPNDESTFFCRYCNRDRENKVGYSGANSEMRRHSTTNKHKINKIAYEQEHNMVLPEIPPELSDDELPMRTGQYVKIKDALRQQFVTWLSVPDNSKYTFHCKVCNKYLIGGEKEVKQHGAGKKHHEQLLRSMLSVPFHCTISDQNVPSSNNQDAHTNICDNMGRMASFYESFATDEGILPSTSSSENNTFSSNLSHSNFEIDLSQSTDASQLSQSTCRSNKSLASDASNLYKSIDENRKIDYDQSDDPDMRFAIDDNAHLSDKELVWKIEILLCVFLAQHNIAIDVITSLVALIKRINQMPKYIIDNIRLGRKKATHIITNVLSVFEIVEMVEILIKK